MQKMYSIFWNMIRVFGFQKKSKTTFYMVKEDIIAFIGIDCPSGIYYFEFAFIPLYFPSLTGGISLNYGNRLEYMDTSLKKTLKNDSSEEEMTNWCKNAKQYIDEKLLPFIEEVSTASGIREYLLHKERYDKTVPLRCAPDHVYNLLIYTEVFLHHMPQAYAAAELFFQSLSRCPYMPYVLERLKNEVKQLLKTAEDSKKLEAVFVQWRAENLHMFQR